MRMKVSFNRFLHNKKLMVFFSIISAIAIWAVIHTMSSSDVRTFTIDTNLDLSGTYAGNNGMRIFSASRQSVDVTVSGSWFVIYNLSKTDIRIEGDYGEIKGVGTWDINLIAYKNSRETDYNIVDVSPDIVRVFCDFVDTVEVKIEADISEVKIDKSTGYRLGAPVIAAAGVENNTITVEGPKSVVSRIASVSAVVDEPDTISEVTTFPASLTAFDENGNVVDTELCTFVGLAEAGNKVNITVPVEVQRTVNFTYRLNNVPTGFKNLSNFIKLSPSSVEIVGSPEQVESFADDIANLGSFDFNHIGLNDAEKVVTLNIPQGIRVMGGTSEVSISFGIEGFKSKTVSMTLTTVNTQVIKKPSDLSWTMSPQKINVTLIGNRKSIDKIKDTNLSAVIDMAGDNTTGVREFRAIIRISDYNDVWVYYGKEEPGGYPVFLTVY
ncbi:MAG: CdaR family protein [Oscillospiraceae bacterium]|nr:CdaR family protein [Oscillospiraceae bacterium]